MDETKFKEFIFQAIQAGKRETSGLVSDMKVKLALLEQSQNQIMDQFKNYHNENLEQHKSILEMVTNIESKLDKALERKANKWTEKFIVGFLVMFGTGVCGYIGSLIIKAILHLNY